MPILAPSLTYASPAEYKAYVLRLATFADHVHVDLMDGDLAPTRSISAAQAWWPATMTADVHLMYRRPTEFTEQLVSMGPRLVVVHPEAEGDLVAFGKHLQQFKIRFGIALMPGAELRQLAPLLDIVDHALIFSGSLGSYGGVADLSRLELVSHLKVVAPEIEIGWDGGVNVENVRALVDGGIDILNVGGALASSPDPAGGYATMRALINESNIQT